MPNKTQNLNQDSGQNKNQKQAPKKEPLSLMTVKILLAVLIFIALGTIVIGGAYLIRKQENDKLNKILPALCKNNFDCPLQTKCKNYICVDTGCVKDGGSFSGAVRDADHMANKCCIGLKRVTASKYYDENCNIDNLLWGGSMSTCSDCGNGICESWENRCNCSEDCEEESNTSDWQTYRNEEFGFEYPNNFKIINEDSEGVDFILDVSQTEFCGDNPECAIPSLGVHIIKEKSVDEYIQKINRNNTIIVTKTGTVNDKIAKWGYAPAMIDYIFVVMESPQNFILEFGLSGSGVLHFEHSPESKKIIETTSPPWDVEPPVLIFDAYNFNQIISSFKFID